MKLTSIIFCDDIRFEMKNKLSLMGLYQAKMIYPKSVQWPVSAKLAMLLTFDINDKKNPKRHFEFKLYIKEKEIMVAKSKFVINELDDSTNLVINAEGLMLEAGELDCSIKVFDENNEIILNETRKSLLKILTE